ncbi:MAG TPA: cbb3-type cytochrome c oxidase subunit II [Opitutaceae bacterium]|nr:cbb3-type cytochrome c oxidase subunit II [Opitutaceae bacterium]
MNASRPPLRTVMAVIFIITATYFYFLIFAEFALLELVRELNVGISPRLVMLALGIGGLGGTFLGAKLSTLGDRRNQLLVALLGCAIGAGMSLVAKAGSMMWLAAAFSGLALGGLTVSLATSLRLYLAERDLGLSIGVGTGFAYALCNVPVIFRATPHGQTALALLAVSIAMLVTRMLPRGETRVSDRSMLARETPRHLGRWIIVLVALVWLDSAGFFIIQHTPLLRNATWQETETLWLNAGIHLSFAVASGFFLDRAAGRWVLGLATALLALALLSLDGVLPFPLKAHIAYVAGVSLYSVALVEIPARHGSPWAAAATFGIAGWVGSALGIGMAQDLARVPPAFIAVACAVVAILLSGRLQSTSRYVLALLAIVTTGRASSDEIRDGREVYIAEGCIHCHSQYVREQVPLEVLNWGPATSLTESLAGSPPLFGTRRQGPDLARVGNRRSPEWNRLHLIKPQSVSPGSRMPAYAHLFENGDTRGPALLAYLASLGAGTEVAREKQITQWAPPPVTAVVPQRAVELFQRLCQHCHGASGKGDGPMVMQLALHPPNWTTDTWRHVDSGSTMEEQISRIIKFGLPGAAMAGHEYLTDAEVVGLARYVRSLHKP